ncbi:MAG: ThuA domain-containing protein [Acidimicrobiia bacterium]|nr:ThuA domain-containing protein [Acidimicrobiia bacterium]
MNRSLLLTGGPPGHDFAGVADELARLLADVGLPAEVVDDPDVALAELASYDLFVVHALRWSMHVDRYAALRDDHAYHLSDDGAEVIDRFVRGGGGLLALHTAVICFDGHPGWRALCGASWSWGQSSHDPLGPVEIEVSDHGRAHLLTAGCEGFELIDEIYGDLDTDDELTPLLVGRSVGRSEGRQHPVLWTTQVGDGRVVTDLLGHSAASFTQPTHRRIVGRAAVWAARTPVEA